MSEKQPKLIPNPMIPQFHVDLPVGAVIAFAGEVSSNSSNLNEHASNIESLGLMECDGRKFKISEHPELFAVLGYKYGGAGDTFNIPNFRGMTPIKGATYIIKYTYNALDFDG
ncbi:MAG: tail fiber protein [bacterium]|nr:tail fiber protein [bacterium]